MRQLTEEEKRIAEIIRQGIEKRKKLAVEREIKREKFMRDFVKNNPPPINPARDAWLAQYGMTYYDIKRSYFTGKQYIELFNDIEHQDLSYSQIYLPDNIQEKNESRKT